MTRLWNLGALCAGLLVALAQASAAQVITVTSGEHIGFTRLVLQAQERFTWRAEMGTQSVTLRLPPRAELRGLDLVFQRIQRERLSALRTDAGNLHLDLGCDCALSIWEERAGLLVIDIAPSQPAGTAPLAPPAPDVARHSPAAGQALARAAGSALAQEWRGQAIVNPPDRTPEVPQALIDALSREVALAQTQGLLLPATDALPTPQALVPITEPGTREATPHPQLRVTSALERPSAEALRLTTAFPDSAECHGTEVLNFLENERTAPFIMEHSLLLAQAYGEFDLPNTGAISSLIALYLTNAMGAEARALIDLSNPPEPGATILRALADLLEERPSNALPQLGRAAGCGDIILALALAASVPGLTPDAQTGARAALGFGLLSPPLRLALGPALAEGLMAADLGQVAQMVISSIRHEPDLPAAALSRLEAQAVLLQGNRAQAIEQLRSAGTGDAAALRLQLQLSRDVNQAPSPTVLNTAEAIAATLRHDAIGTEILLLTGELRAMDGDHAGALAIIDRAKLWSRDRPSIRVDIAQAEAAIWATIAQSPSDAAFLETALSQDEWRRADMPVSVTAAVASRLDRFGLGPGANVQLPGQMETLRLEPSPPEGPARTEEERSPDAALSAEFSGRFAIGEGGAPRFDVDEELTGGPINGFDPSLRRIPPPSTQILATLPPSAEAAGALSVAAPEPLALATGQGAISQTGAALAPTRADEQAVASAPQVAGLAQAPASGMLEEGREAVGALAPQPLQGTALEPQVGPAQAPASTSGPQTTDNAPPGPQPLSPATLPQPVASEAMQNPRVEMAEAPQVRGNQMQQAASLLAGGEALRAAVAAQLGRAP